MAGVNAYRFSTKYFDAENNLYYCGYRYYSAELGRWIKLDPLDELGSFNLRLWSKYFDSVADPHFSYIYYSKLKSGRNLRQSQSGLKQGMNEYGYVNDNPINIIDQFGLSDYNVKWDYESFSIKIFGIIGVGGAQVRGTVKTLTSVYPGL